MSKVDHEINSYNSLIMNQTNKNNQKFNKTYSSSKLFNSKEISSSKNKNQLLSDKKAVHNANLNCFNTDNTLNKNLKNISKKQFLNSTLYNTKTVAANIKTRGNDIFLWKRQQF